MEKEKFEKKEIRSMERLLNSLTIFQCKTQDIPFGEVEQILTKNHLDVDSVDEMVEALEKCLEIIKGDN